MTTVDWTEANQRVLVAEFARLRTRIDGAGQEDAARELASVRASIVQPAAIDLLAEAFELTPFERDVLLLCAGNEMDGGLAAAAAQAGNAINSPGVSFALALACFAEPHWSAIAPVQPLRLWRLLEVRTEDGVCNGKLRIDERVLHYLVGINYLDIRLQPLLREHRTAAPLGERQARRVDAALQVLRTRPLDSLLIQLEGSDAPGQREVARAIAAGIGRGLYVMSEADVPLSPHEAQAFTRLWSRELVLLRAALLVQVEEVDQPHLARFVSELGGLVFVAGNRVANLDRVALRISVDSPERSEQRQLWLEVLGEHADRLNGSLDAIASRFRVGTDVMTQAADSLRAAPGESHAVQSIVLQSCRDSIRRRLAGLAERIQPVATWDDLILPEAQVATLRQIATHVRRRAQVYEEWGFAGSCTRGLGISALFSGESGTGKTMAAEVLANELELDVYRIDLASIVSKYIGETEKNLRRVFDAAEDGAAILLFDEADALFGKRSEVNDSHDRYANIEVSYLLQRMEAYRGLAILTTNLKSSLDTAFQRRIRFVVQFPFPDATLRERIWRRVFPAGTPLAPLDCRRLAQLNVTGGSIRNIALNAAFLAAEASSSLDMGHLLNAARSEAVKSERPYSDAETRGWA